MIESNAEAAERPLSFGGHRGGFRLSSFTREAMNSVNETGLMVKAISLLLFIAYILTTIWPSLIEILTVTPGLFWPPHFYIWTAFTFCFVEGSIIFVIFDIIILFMVSGKLLTPLWGGTEVLVFFFVVNIGTAMSSAFCYYILYMITFNASFLFTLHIFGFAGYWAGVTVAIKQIMPDYVIYRTPMGKFTNRNLPLTIFLITVLLFLVGIEENMKMSIMFFNGLMVSWIYLRFYQVHNNKKGDLADSMSFANFFPTVLQPPISLICNFIFALLIRLRICQKPQPMRKYNVGANMNSPSSISISLPGVDHDSERRRHIALAALSERLGASKAATEESDQKSSWPLLLDESTPQDPLESVHVVPATPENAALNVDAEDNVIKEEK